MKQPSAVCDLLVTGGTFITMDRNFSIHEEGCMAIQNGRILRIGRLEDFSDISAQETLDARGKVILPGFVNTHTHIAMAAFRGAVEDVPNRLADYIFPMERNLVTPDLVYKASLFCLCEMALSGTTTFADMYYFEDEVAKAVKKAGLRALLGETVLGSQAPDAPEPYGGLRYARDFIQAWRSDSLVHPMIAPHAPYTVDSGHLLAVREVAEDLDVPIMMHIAETEPEHRTFSASHGSVMRYLDATGFLSKRLIGVHMIYLDDFDIELAAKSGMSVAHVPVSNAKAGRPICPAWRMQKKGIRVGLATDGPLSGNLMDLQTTVSFFPKLQKMRENRRDIVSAKDALRTATLGGAEALGMDTDIGSLEAGKCADFIVINPDSFTMQPIYDLYAAIVYAMRPDTIESIFVQGKKIAANRHMTTLDEAEVLADMKAIAANCKNYIRSITPKNPAV